MGGRPGDAEAKAAERPRIAFYGSLMAGLGPADALGVARWLAAIGTCALPGWLHDLGRYPGLVLGAGRVRGELYEVRSPGVFEVLDAFEGFDPEDRERSLFRREPVPLLAPDGTAWVYVYNRSVAGRPRVASGDWRSHLRTRST